MTTDLELKRAWRKYQRGISRAKVIEIIRSVNLAHPAGVTEKGLHSTKTLGISIALAGLIFITGCINGRPACAQAVDLVNIKIERVKQYSDQEIVNAIYKAEGGKNARRPYGIISVKCTNEKECRRICLNTVRRNRKRYQEDAERSTKDYLSYLSRNYAPIGSGTYSQENNNNWLKNVKYFLDLERKNKNERS